MNILPVLLMWSTVADAAPPAPMFSREERVANAITVYMEFEYQVRACANRNERAALATLSRRWNDVLGRLMVSDQPAVERGFREPEYFINCHPAAKHSSRRAVMQKGAELLNVLDREASAGTAPVVR